MAKKPFAGFPTRAEVTPVPNLFFTAVLPEIEEIAELKLVLHLFWQLSRQRGYPFVTYGGLLSDAVLMNSLGKEGDRDEALRKALDLAAERGAVLHLGFERDGKHEDAYFINTEVNRQTVDKIRRGQIVLPGLVQEKESAAEARPLLDIFTAYEQNIGMLTPMIAEELKEAERLYPPDWIDSAFREAVALNKRSWRYISSILERWSTEGRSDGKSGRDTKKENGRGKYARGQYGHMVKH